MKYIYLILLFLFSCQEDNREQVVETTEADSALQNSMKLNDSSLALLDLADKKTEVMVKQVITKVDRLESINVSLKNEIKSLKEVSKMTKTIVIHDTIFITEKKNFWGKTKTKIDSSQSVVVQDSVQHK